eukprot:g70763.t1
MASKSVKAMKFISSTWQLWHADGMQKVPNLYLPVPMEDEVQNKRDVRGGSARNATTDVQSSEDAFEWQAEDAGAFKLEHIKLSSSLLLVAAEPFATSDCHSKHARTITVSTELGAIKSSEKVTTREAVPGEPHIVYMTKDK